MLGANWTGDGDKERRGQGKTGQDEMKEKIVTGARWRCDERRAPRQARGVLPRLDLQIVSHGHLRSGHGDDKGERGRRN